jgi:glycosyltransferase involved in cell wall biosynthesis
MWRGETVSVVLPTYNERDSIGVVIEDFFTTGVVDEVLVVNNNAAHGTSDEVARTAAREVLEARQGYGWAIRRGLEEAAGRYIVVCEPDGTFLARDVFKLLAYAEDFDVVYGSRTSQQLIWHGANMGLFLRWGNWVVAKYLEFLYNATSLTDVGCTMRLVRREVAHQLLPVFRIGGNAFGPEMMTLSLRARLRVVQVPVNYLPRVGVSSVTGDPLKAFALGLRMIGLITSRRFGRLAAPGASSRERAGNE